MRVLGYLFILAILTLIVLGFFGKFFQGEAAIFVNDTVSHLANRGWNAMEFEDNASPELLKRPDDFNGMLTAGRSLGRVKKIGDPECLFFRYTGKSAAACYNTPADFENGKAVIQVWLTRLDGEWKISNLLVATQPEKAPTAGRSPSTGFRKAVELKKTPFQSSLDAPAHQ